jgi:predicted PurR-regulated permease PerM
MVLFTYLILSSNVVILTELFGTIGIWLNNPATNPLDFGIPVAKATLFDLLNKGTALFVDYQTTLIGNLSLIAFKIFVFFVSLFSLLRWGEQLNMKFTSHVPEVLSGYFRKLSGVTVDTLYAIYIVQIAIAVLTFFIALPVFYLLGYGDILFYSFFAAFCELIPVIGSSTVFVLVGTYALALGDTRGVLILFFLGYLIVSLVPEVYVRPVMVGISTESGSSMPPLVRFLSSSLRISTRSPSGSTVSRCVTRVLAFSAMAVSFGVGAD